MVRKAAGIVLIIAGITILIGVLSCGVMTTPIVGNAAAGATLFAAQCEPCHTFGTIKPVSNLITNDMGTIDPQMADIFLTNQQIADLQAYLL